MLTQ
jgi:hypothetical protein